VIKKTAVLLGALASVLGSVHARAGLVGGNGTSCVASTSFDSPWLNNGRNGVFNGDSVSRSFSCGLVRLSSSSPRNLYINWWDASPTGRVSCFVNVNTFTGSPLWSQTQSSDIAAKLVGGVFEFILPQSAVGYVSTYCTLPAKDGGQSSGVGGHYLQ
jgi:hypothetical protein